MKNLKELAKMYVEVCVAIKRTKSSINEISLTAIGTLSLTDLKEKFLELAESGVITKSQYETIFSEKTVAELRPYKGTLMHLTDTDMGIVSKDYVCDILSYIIGVKLPSASSGAAWENARKFVESLGMTAEIVDINSVLSPAVFAANNYNTVIETKMSDKYEHFSLPVVIKEEEDCVMMLEYRTSETLWEAAERQRKELNAGNPKGFVFSFVKNTLGLIEDVAWHGSEFVESLDFSTELTEEGKNNRIPVFSYADVFGKEYSNDSMFEDDYYGEYYDECDDNGDEYESEDNSNPCEDTEYDCDDELPFL